MDFFIYEKIEGTQWRKKCISIFLLVSNVFISRSSRGLSNILIISSNISVIYKAKQIRRDISLKITAFLKYYLFKVKMFLKRILNRSKFESKKYVQHVINYCLQYFKNIFLFTVYTNGVGMSSLGYISHSSRAPRKLRSRPSHASSMVLGCGF